jgi:hypothetical protein
MKRERPELPLAGMNRDRCGAKIPLRGSDAAVDTAVMSRCRNLTNVDAMILQQGNFGKGCRLTPVAGWLLS